MLNQITEIILSACREQNDVSPPARKIAVESGGEAPVYGGKGPLDSLGLVSLIVIIEQKIEDELGATITLADERAASQSASPFRTVGTMADFAMNLINENRGNA